MFIMATERLTVSSDRIERPNHRHIQNGTTIHSPTEITTHILTTDFREEIIRAKSIRFLTEKIDSNDVI